MSSLEEVILFVALVIDELTVLVVKTSLDSASVLTQTTHSSTEQSFNQFKGNR